MRGPPKGAVTTLLVDAGCVLGRVCNAGLNAASTAHQTQGLPTGPLAWLLFTCKAKKAVLKIQTPWKRVAERAASADPITVTANTLHVRRLCTTQTQTASKALDTLTLTQWNMQATNAGRLASQADSVTRKLQGLMVACCGSQHNQLGSAVPNRLAAL